MNFIPFLPYLSKTILIIVLVLIFWQDTKDRLVYWFLYPLVAILGFSIQLQVVDVHTILLASLINLIFIITTLLVLWVYMSFIIKKQLLQSIGLGDVMFFFAVPFCFSTISFVILFVFSLLCALLLHLVFKNRYKRHKTIPLAGYMSFFFILIYTYTFFVHCNFLFAY